MEEEDIYGAQVPESCDMKVEESSFPYVSVASLERQDYSFIQSQVDEIDLMNRSGIIEMKQKKLKSKQPLENR